MNSRNHNGACAASDPALEALARCLSEVCQSDSLRKAKVVGKSVVARCRRNADKKPSLYVYKDRKPNGAGHWFFTCHSCGDTGRLEKLIMEDTGMSWRQARATLAQYLGDSVTELEPSHAHVGIAGDPQLLDFIACFCNHVAWDDHVLHRRLMKHQREYLEGRVSPRQIRQMGIGIAPYSKIVKHKLSRFLGRMPSPGLYEEARNILRRIAGRIVIPVRDESGHVVSLCTRSIRESTTNRYLDVGSKHEVVLGLDKAKDAISRTNHVIVVEGAFDLYTLRELGACCLHEVLVGGKDAEGHLHNVVACQGALPTTAQLNILLSHTNNILMIRDGDRADDIEGTLSFIEKATQIGFHAAVGVVPNDMDPDEYVKSLMSRGLKPEEILQVFNDTVLHPASEWEQSLVAQLARRHPSRDMAFWSELRGIVSASPEPNKAMAAAAYVFGVALSDLEEEYRRACCELERQIVREAYAKADVLPNAKIGRGELEAVLAMCNPTEVRMWVVLRAEAAKLGSTDGTFSVSGDSIARNCGVGMRQARNIMKSLRDKGLIDWDKMAHESEFRVSMSPAPESNFILVPFDFIWKGHARRLGTRLPVLLVLKASAMPGKPMTNVLIKTVADRTHRKEDQVALDIKYLIERQHVKEYQVNGRLKRLVSLMPVQSEIPQAHW